MRALLLAILFLTAAVPALAAEGQIQRILADRVVFAPVWENAPINGVGPRVAEAAVTQVTSYPYTAPFEELRLKTR